MKSYTYARALQAALIGKSVVIALVTFASLSSALADQCDASRGQQDFRACALTET
jgi:hypothetical protein